MSSKSNTCTAKLKENLKLCIQNPCCLFRKRDKPFKLELTENKVDSESKKNMIRHFKHYHLDFVEKKEMAGETFIKVNVSPIVKDKQKMEEFINYIKSGAYRVKYATDKSLSCDNLNKSTSSKATITGNSTGRHKNLNYIQKSVSSSDSFRDMRQRENVNQQEIKWNVSKEYPVKELHPENIINREEGPRSGFRSRSESKINLRSRRNTCNRENKTGPKSHSREKDNVIVGNQYEIKRKGSKEYPAKESRLEDEDLCSASSVDLHSRRIVFNKPASHSQSESNVGLYRKNIGNKRGVKTRKCRSRHKFKHYIALRRETPSQKRNRKKSVRSNHMKQLSNERPMSRDREKTRREERQKENSKGYPLKKNGTFIDSLNPDGAIHQVGYMIGREKDVPTIAPKPIVSDATLERFINSYVRKKCLANTINLNKKQIGKPVVTEPDTSERREINRITVREIEKNPLTNLKTTTVIFKNNQDGYLSSEETDWIVSTDNKNEFRKIKQHDIIYKNFQSTMRGGGAQPRNVPLDRRMHNKKIVLKKAATFRTKYKTADKLPKKAMKNSASNRTHSVLNKLKDKCIDIDKKKKELIGFFMGSRPHFLIHGHHFNDATKSVDMKGFRRDAQTEVAIPKLNLECSAAVRSNRVDQGNLKTCKALATQEFPINKNQSFKMGNTASKITDQLYEMNKSCVSNQRNKINEMESTSPTELNSQQGELKCVKGLLAKCLSELHHLQETHNTKPNVTHHLLKTEQNYKFRNSELDNCEIEEMEIE